MCVCACVCASVSVHVWVGGYAYVGGWLGVCTCGVCEWHLLVLLQTTVHVIPKCARFVYMCYPITLTSVPPFLLRVTSWPSSGHPAASWAGFAVAAPGLVGVPTPPPAPGGRGGGRQSATHSHQHSNNDERNVGFMKVYIPRATCPAEHMVCQNVHIHHVYV